MDQDKVKLLLDTEAGKGIIEYLVEYSGMLKSLDTVDVQIMARHYGARSIVTHLIDLASTPSSDLIRREINNRKNQWTNRLHNPQKKSL